ncbi:uncharacterized protein ACNS7B_001972 [Menidia menidia]
MGNLVEPERKCALLSPDIYHSGSHSKRRRSTMTGFGWMCRYLVLMLLFSATEENDSSSVMVRAGGDAVLSCERLDRPVSCENTNWAFSDGQRGTTELVKNGKINHNQEPPADPNRLRVTSNCSLMIHGVTAGDGGQYQCNQFPPRYEKHTNEVCLLVVDITEKREPNGVTITCSVSTYKSWEFKVKWLFKGQNIDDHHKELKVTKTDCSASITFQSSHFLNQSQKYELLKCEVGADDRSEKFDVFPPSSGDKTSGNNNASSQPSSGWWWVYVLVSVALAALLTAVLLLIGRSKNKGKKIQTEEKLGSNFITEVAHCDHEGGQHTTDSEDGPSYSTIVHIKNNSKVRRNDSAVTYSTVKVGASTDPSGLYASIN